LLVRSHREVIGRLHYENRHQGVGLRYIHDSKAENVG